MEFLDYTKYQYQSVKSLKGELKKRGLKVSGKKIELVERLEQDDEIRFRVDGIITVFAKTMMGTFYDININKDATGLQLKMKIADKLGINPDKVTIYANILTDNPLPGDVVYGDICRRKMKDEKTLADQEVFHESTVNIHTRLF